MATIEMVPKRALSFREFIGMSEQQRRAVGRVTIVPPQLGVPGFGYVFTEKPVFVRQPPKARVSKGRSKRLKK